jgi:hypothetical protein
MVLVIHKVVVLVDSSEAVGTKEEVTVVVAGFVVVVVTLR